MSFQIKPRYGRMVVCDICGEFGVIGDWDWRKVRTDAEGEPIHLCRVCRPAAAWCAEHEQYHLHGSLHRPKCVSCGGLFTIRFGQQGEHCPQCRRNLPAQPVPRQPTLAAAIYKFFASGHA